MKRFIVLIAMAFLPLLLKAQGGIIEGKVSSAVSNSPLDKATLLLIGTQQSAVTDSAGRFRIINLTPGFYNMQVSNVGYVTKIVYEVQVTNAGATELNISLDDDQKQLGEVKITASSQRDKTLESPVSLHTVGSTEIERNPGGNRDISKVIQSFPGVSAPVGFRNDIIIRGGSPDENRFYIDGVEIPNINHFATQGASGGPVGLINVDFIKDVDFYSGAFPADRGNALSSVFDFKLKDGPTDTHHETLTLGSSDLAASYETPIGDKTTLISSYRYSYLQTLFKLLNIPYLPAYQDAQFKLKTKFDKNNELTFLGLGAIDKFTPNQSASTTEINRYELANIFNTSQDNYTIGTTFKHYRSNGYTLFVLSRDYLNNKSIKYIDNVETNPKSLDYTSVEAENKFRVENLLQGNGFRLNFGADAETAHYNTYTYNLLPFGNNIYTSDLNFFKYNLFGQLSRSFFNDKLSLSVGVRADANTYSEKMNNLLNTFSPRFSASYNVTDNLSINFNTGIYYQLPAYTVLGYRDSTNTLVNKNVNYISNKQLVLGFEYNTLKTARFTVEGFYKFYQNYPLVRVLGDTIPLANLGAGFGVVGNDPVAEEGDGRSYGVEFFAQQRLNKGFYGIFAFTLYRSEFQDKNGVYVPSSWDNSFILSMTAGKILPRNWELGAKLRFTGGSPYTPYDQSTTSLYSNYNIDPQSLPNYKLLNTATLGNFYQLDFRVDKKYYLKKYTLNAYVDIQNLTNNIYNLQANLVPDRDANGNLQPLPGDPTRFKTKYLNNPSGNILPTVGVILAF